MRVGWSAGVRGGLVRKRRLDDSRMVSAFLLGRTINCAFPTVVYWSI